MLSSFVAVFLLLTGCFCFEAVPLVVASHKLVTGLRNELTGDNSVPYLADEATNMIKKLVTQCSSDEYLLVNQPGLRLNDVTDLERDNWPHLYKYLTLSSSLVGLPWVDGPVDLDYLEQYIIGICRAETINVEHENENEVDYIDSKTRVIRIELSDLPPESDMDARRLEMRQHDLLLRQILRKLPSPHYTIIFTASDTQHYHPVPKVALEHSPIRFNVFDSITNDPLRREEVERNDRFHRPKPGAPHHRNPIHHHVENMKNEVHLFSRKTWESSERVIAAVVVMASALFMRGVFTSVRRVTKERKQR